MLSGKSWEKGWRVRWWGVCLPKQSLCVMRPYFQGSGWLLPADGKQRTNLLYLLFFCTWPLFSFLKLLLSQTMSFSPYFLPLSHWEMRVAWWVPGSQPRSTHHSPSCGYLPGASEEFKIRTVIRSGNGQNTDWTLPGNGIIVGSYCCWNCGKGMRGREFVNCPFLSALWWCCFDFGEFFLLM